MSEGKRREPRQLVAGRAHIKGECTSQKCLLVDRSTRGVRIRIVEDKYTSKNGHITIEDFIWNYRCVWQIKDQAGLELVSPARKSEVTLRYHIPLTASLAKRIRNESSESENLPRSDIKLLAEKLDASLITQRECSISFSDKVNGKVIGSPEIWAFARSLVPELGPDDVIFCTGEGIGIPFAIVFGKKRHGPKIVVWFHRPESLRVRYSFKFFDLKRKIDFFVVNSIPNEKILRGLLDTTDDRILSIRHPIDTGFFVPRESTLQKNRPLVISIGLERRDYRLLAAATSELNIDVKVSGNSQFFSRTAKSFPNPLPRNMTNQWYPFADLLQLYYDADIVVIPLKENDSAAGATALLEAMSFCKPIICVRTAGLADYLSDSAAVMAIEPGDVVGLKQAILHLLGNPEEAKARSVQARRMVLSRHNLDKQVEKMAKCIRKIEKN